MSKEKFLVVTSAKGKSRSWVWETDSPLGLGHPFRWVLERTDSGVWIRDLKSGGRHYSEAEIKSGSAFSLNEKGDVSVRFRAVNPLRAAFLRQEDAPSPDAGLSSLLAFTGTRRNLISCQPIHHAFVAYHRGLPVFTVTRSGQSYRIKTLVHGVKMKPKGQSSILGEVGRTWNLNEVEFTTATFSRKSQWWRFTLVPTAEPISERTSSVGDDEDAWLKRAMVGAGISLFLLFGAVFLIGRSQQQQETELKKIAKAPVVKIGLTRGKLRGLEAAKPMVATEAPEPEVAASKPVAKKSPQRSAAPAAPVAEVAPPKKAPPEPPKSNPKAVAQAKALAAKLSGALALANRVSVPGRTAGVGHSKEAAQFFAKDQGAGGALERTNVNAGVAVTEGDVGVLGGRGGAGGGSGNVVGYSGLAHGGVYGQGGSFAGLGGRISNEKGLTKEEVGRVIHDHMGEIRYCHESAMVYDPKLQGKALIKFTINPAGRVSAASISESNLGNSPLAPCVVSRLKTWQFPRPKGGIDVTVTYPFLFKTLGGQ